MSDSKELLTRRVEKILPSKEGFSKLLKSKKKIRLYQGFDATAPKLHLGHTVGLRKLMEFANAGHEVIFLFGTGTVLVGDPSQRDSGRKLITQKEVSENIKSWKQQVAPIIDFDKITIKQNGDWLTKLTLTDIIKIASNISAVQLFKRDSFQTRIKQGSTVWYHETMYPLLQGYDSVAMDVDLEIGGTDQEFNMLIGRELQRKMKHHEKFVLTMPLIPGSDGKPMSKTAGNCIWLTDVPNDMYGKIMKVQDKLVPQYFEFFTDIPMKMISKLKSQLKSNPLKVKKQLALTITSDFHGSIKAKAAQNHFQSVVQRKQTPKDIKTIVISPGTHTALATVAQADLGSSNSDRKRVIIQGGLEIDGQKTTDPQQKIDLKGGEVIKYGKREFRKVRLK